MLDQLRAAVRGELPRPPVAQLVGFTLAAVAEGRSSAVLEAGPQHANPMGTRHGDRLRQYPS
jgi:acyl-coenzyme A thioesterase PaaI-like protein